MVSHFIHRDPIGRKVLVRAFVCLVVLFVAGVSESDSVRAQTSKAPFEIKIAPVKTNVKESTEGGTLPVDPTVRIRHGSSGNMTFGLQTLGGKRLTISNGTGYHKFKIDGTITQVSNASSIALGPDRRGKSRTGRAYLWRYSDIEVRQEQILVPSTLPGPSQRGQKRKRDAFLFRYKIVNKGKKAKKVGLRIRIDMYNGRTDGPVFWSPTTHPKKILNGVSLVGKEIPKYLISIENSNLQSPGNLAYFNFNTKRGGEKPSKLVLTRHGYTNAWEVAPQRINGDSDIVIYFAEKKLAPGATRIFSWGYGSGIAGGLTHDGLVRLKLSGSFEPKGIFLIRAYVKDPGESQSLSLKLPKGMKLLEGNTIQPIPAPNEDNTSYVVWKGRVLRPGTFPIEIVSSNGIVSSTTVTVAKK
ncbi:MAG: hypothetical protein ACFCD0_25325 [Gemmataceae bacterium]